MTAPILDRIAVLQRIEPARDPEKGCTFRRKKGPSDATIGRVPGQMSGNLVNPKP